MADKQGVVMLEKSAFNRRLHCLADTLSALFYYLADFFKTLNLSCQYLIDSFPVAVCDNIRISRSRLIQGEHYRGKMASKRRFFYGFRVQVVTTLERQPDPAWQAAYKKSLRQGIEQAFSQITMRLPKKIHAVTEAGFLIKIVLFLLAYALETNLQHTT